MNQIQDYSGYLYRLYIHIVCSNKIGTPTICDPFVTTFKNHQNLLQYATILIRKIVENSSFYLFGVFILAHIEYE